MNFLGQSYEILIAFINARSVVCCGVFYLIKSFVCKTNKDQTKIGQKPSNRCSGGARSEVRSSRYRFLPSHGKTCQCHTMVKLLWQQCLVKIFDTIVRYALFHPCRLRQMWDSWIVGCCVVFFETRWFSPATRRRVTPETSETLQRRSWARPALTSLTGFSLLAMEEWGLL